MIHLPDRFIRLLPILALCLIGSVIIVDTFVLAQNSMIDPAVDLSEGIEPGNSPSGNILSDSGAVPDKLNTILTATIYLPVVMGESGDILGNGGVVIGVDGVGIGALTSTLSAPVAVTISKTDAPTVTLPSQAQMAGGFYQIRANEDVYVSTANPFILAFPVPSGVNKTNLALATLSSSESVNDAAEGLQAWTLLEGMYNPDQDLFLTTIAGLTKKGSSFILVTHPDFDSPSNDTTASLFRPTHPSGTQFQLFNVKCINFNDPNDCTATTESTVADFLTDIYGRIHQDLGFNEPRLRYLNEKVKFNPNLLSSLGYKTYIEPHDSGYCASEPAAGYYQIGKGRLVLCLNPAVGLSSDAVYTLIHEYFHATQYAYSPFMLDFKDKKDEKWIVEGMANSAEESYFVDEMLRSEVSGWVDLHKVDRSLLSEVGHDEYYAQDFWVFHGQKKSLGLPYLETILEAGAKTEDVVNVLGDGAYWDWMKNQVMVEDNITFEGQLGSPCNLEFGVVDTFYIFDLYLSNELLQHQGNLPPLTSHVISLEIAADLEGLTQYVEVTSDLIGPDESDPDLRYKVYVDGETSCTDIEDGPRALTNLITTEDYYVVVSNLSQSETKPYTITSGPLLP